METKTPPDTTGFKRKPNRNPGHNAGKNKFASKKGRHILTQKEVEQARCLGGMLFLIYAAKQLAELFSDAPVATRKSL